jgi:hypothetical protein
MSSTYPESERVFVAPPVAAAVEAPAITSDSGISWAAIVAGAVAAAAVAITLLIFGAGLGLSSVSPWPHQGVSVTTFTVLAAIWLVLVQWISSAFGGYIAGRLRTKWVSLHTDEVFFRDTAHGFLAWGLATVAVATLLSFASQGAATAGAQLASNSTLTETASTYYVDLLFRQNVAPPGTGSALAPADNGSAAMVTGLSDRDTRAQATTILAENAANGGNVSQQDNAYLVQLVSGRTGLSPNDAQLRVNTVVAREQADIVKAKQLADSARKASAEAAIYTFVSLLIGAFIASVAGAIGGRLRDTY